MDKIQILPKLYKQKTKKIMQWWITYDKTSYTVYHGYVDGKIQDTTTNISSGKNIGKKNETSVAEQVEAEAKALWQKQKDRKGYSPNINQEKPLMPMLAQKWQDYGDRLSFPLYIQRKYDGVCCLAHIKDGAVKLLSRQNKEFPPLMHILKPLQKLQDVVLHGELYSKQISFREIISGIKDQSGNDFTNLIEYHVYDVATAKTYEERLQIINSLGLQHPIIPVPTYKVHSIKEIDEHYLQFVKDGFEGAMIRDPKGVYEFDKRSRSLLKYKKFQDAEYTIVGAQQNKGKLENTCTFICQTSNGTEFGAMPDGDLETRETYWKDWKRGIIDIGAIATIEFFEYTDDINQIPRFPILKAIRDYE